MTYFAIDIFSQHSSRAILFTGLMLVLINFTGAQAQAQSAKPLDPPPNVKSNMRVKESGATVATAATVAPGGQSVPPEDSAQVQFFYEFKQPDFFVRYIRIAHDNAGHGEIQFEQKSSAEAITEPLEISSTSLKRLMNLWTGLDFLVSGEEYQSAKQFPHLGTTRVGVRVGVSTGAKNNQIGAEKPRTAEFNWTDNKLARELVDEYRKLTEQYLFIFNIKLAAENQPLEAPKLIDHLDSLLARNGISDFTQLLPLLKEASIDDRLPLIARDHIQKIIKKYEKKK